MEIKKIISHAKEYGFIFPSSDIYEGLSAVYDYAHNGVELKNNIKNYWWKAMVNLHSNIVGIDSAIFMHPTTWKASGHVDAFNDPLIDNKDSKLRYRADSLVEEYCEKLDNKILKEISKAKKRFGKDFDEDQFLNKKDSLLEMVASFENEFSDPKEFKTMFEFMGSFYEVLEDNIRFNKVIVAEARTK